jgi:hypothetical protein
MIDDTTTDQDLPVPPSNHFEKLRGNLMGRHWIRVQQSVAAVIPVGWQRREHRAPTSTTRRPQLPMRRSMPMTKRKPATVGEILVEEFMQPIGLTARSRVAAYPGLGSSNK